MREQRIPGLSLAVTIDNELIFTKGYGLANVELRSPAAGGERLRGGLAHQAVHRRGRPPARPGRQARARRSRQPLPARNAPGLGKDHPAPPAHPHLRHPRLRRRRPAARPPPRLHRGRTRQAGHHAAARSSRPACAGTTATPPTSCWASSSTGSAGRFYGDFLRERVFSRLHMGSTRVIGDDDLLPFRAAATGSTRAGSKTRNGCPPASARRATAGWFPPSSTSPSGTPPSSPARCCRRTVWKDVFTPVTLNSGKTFPYGFGWFIREQNGAPYYEHSGHLQGFASHILRFPQARVSVVVLANLAQADPWQIAHGVASLIRPDLKPPADHPIEDKEPAVTALLKTRAGRIARRASAQGDAFTEDGANAYNADGAHGRRNGSAAAAVRRVRAGQPRGGGRPHRVPLLGARRDAKWLLEVSLDTDSGKIDRLAVQSALIPAARVHSANSLPIASKPDRRQRVAPDDRARAIAQHEPSVAARRHSTVGIRPSNDDTGSGAPSNVARSPGNTARRKASVTAAVAGRHAHVERDAGGSFPPRGSRPSGGIGGSRRSPGDCVARIRRASADRQRPPADGTRCPRPISKTCSHSSAGGGSPSGGSCVRSACRPRRACQQAARARPLGSKSRGPMSSGIEPCVSMCQQPPDARRHDRAVTVDQCGPPRYIPVLPGRTTAPKSGGVCQSR